MRKIGHRQLEAEALLIAEIQNKEDDNTWISWLIESTLVPVHGIDDFVPRANAEAVEALS